MVGAIRMATESGLTAAAAPGEDWPVREKQTGWWDGPWPWLVYLVFYPLPYAWAPPNAAQLIASALGLAVFLPVNILSYRLGGMRLVFACGMILAVAITLAPWGGSWTVFSIYAGAAAARLRPYRFAALLIVAVAVVTVATGLLMAQPLFWWGTGVLLVLVTGGANLSREAFYDRTRALLGSQEEVRRLAGTAERERMQRDLHDVVGRTLTLIALKADLAERLVPGGATAATAEVRAIAGIARAGLAEVRAALAGEAGGELTHEITASMAALQTAGVAPRLVGDPACLPGEAGGVLAMTLREAVTNVVRHAGAGYCRIELTMEAGTARLIVADDGTGGAFREGNGIAGMRQGLIAAGGSLAIDTGGVGTRLIAAVPA